MKKKLLYGLAVVILGSVFALNVLATSGGNPFPTQGGGAEYDRYDVPCTKNDKEKTYCLSGGNQLCTDKYCD